MLSATRATPWMVTPEYPSGTARRQRAAGFGTAAGPTLAWPVLPARADPWRAGAWPERQDPSPGVAGLVLEASAAILGRTWRRPDRARTPVQSTVAALYLLNQAWYAMPPAFLQIQSEEQSCHALACLTAAFGRGAQIVQTFIVGVREAGIPPPYTAEAGRLIAAASRACRRSVASGSNSIGRSGPGGAHRHCSQM